MIDLIMAPTRAVLVIVDAGQLLDWPQDSTTSKPVVHPARCAARRCPGTISAAFQGGLGASNVSDAKVGALETPIPSPPTCENDKERKSSHNRVEKLRWAAKSLNIS